MTEIKKNHDEDVVVQAIVGRAVKQAGITVVGPMETVIQEVKVALTRKEIDWFGEDKKNLI